MCETQVVAGMAWLDLHAPGWERKVNLDELDQGDCKSCVLGQLTGDYRYVNPPSYNKDWTGGWKSLLVLPNLVTGRSRELGFERPIDDNYRELTAAWKRAIAARLASPPVKRSGRVTELRLPRFTCDPVGKEMSHADRLHR